LGVARLGEEEVQKTRCLALKKCDMGPDAELLEPRQMTKGSQKKKPKTKEPGGWIFSRKKQEKKKSRKTRKKGGGGRYTFNRQPKLFPHEGQREEEMGPAEP